MDFEQALEKQRLALLRLLAGLMVVVVLMSRVPVVSLAPCWVRRHVLSVLVRAETAANYLVIAAAGILFGARVETPLIGLSPPSSEPPMPDDCSHEGLLRRIEALRTVLRNLPRSARRLIKRQAKRRLESGLAMGAPRLGAHEKGALTVGLLFVARLDRPPDKPFLAAFHPKFFASS